MVEFNEFEVDDHPSLFCECGLPHDTCVCGWSDKDFETSDKEAE